MLQGASKPANGGQGRVLPWAGGRTEGPKPRIPKDHSPCQTQVPTTVGRGCHLKAARGDGGAAILECPRTDPIFDIGDRGPGTTRELSLIFQRVTLAQQGREGGVTPYFAQFPGLTMVVV